VYDVRLIKTYDSIVYKGSTIQSYQNSIYLFQKKSLKIPNRQPKSVNRRRTDNTMAKGKRTQGETTICQTLHRKIKV